MRQYETESVVSLKPNEEESQEEGRGLSVRNAAESKDRIVKSPLDGALGRSWKNSTRTISVYCGINSAIGVGLEKGIGGKKSRDRTSHSSFREFCCKREQNTGCRN